MKTTIIISVVSVLAGLGVGQIWRQMNEPVHTVKIDMDKLNTSPDPFVRMSKLIEEADMLSESCAKYGRDDPLDDSCKSLDAIEKKLSANNICYGHKGERPEYQSYHVCDSDSIPIKIGVVDSYTTTPRDQLKAEDVK